MKKITFISILLFLIFISSSADASSSLVEGDYFSVASSADGNKVITADYTNGYIYTSADSGLTWKEQTNSGLHMWRAVASSADGSKLVAADSLFGYIYTSTDSGNTWKAQVSSGRHVWNSVASSADGSKLVAVDQGTYIATSNDSGSTWNEQYNPDKHAWASITSSADGTKLAAVGDSHIYISTDSGVKWKQVENLDNIAWQSISLSADGTKLAAAPLRDCIYTSNDSGATWIKKTASGIANWVSITSSSDGTKLAAATNKEEVVDGQSSYSGYIYVSSDNGSTWVNKTPEGGRNWRSITSSANGSKIFAGSPNGYVFNFQNSSIAPEAVVNILKTSSGNKTIAPSSKILTASAPANLRGKILIQVESHGEAWYINPKDGKRYYMANGGEALKIMRNFGIGISNKDADKMKIDANFRKRFMGKILLQVESHGEAYYISFDGRYNYLKDGDAALAVMKKLGLGISNSNLEKISAN